jgi:hypothetical protein
MLGSIEADAVDDDEDVDALLLAQREKHGVMDK